MALTNTSIQNVRTCVENINNDIKYGNIQYDTEAVYSCYNTYQYVANNLKEWADDTTIGAESKQTLLKLSNILLQLIEETRVLENKINTFCDNQEKINGAKYVDSITNSNYDRTKGYEAGDLSAFQ